MFSNLKALLGRLTLAAALVCCLSLTSFANLSNGNIGLTVDENCNGTLNGFTGILSLPCALQNDPGPGGLTSVMTYDMLNPPGLVAGDVLLADAECGGCILDVIRFNPTEIGPGGGTGSLVFYSDNIGGFDSGADTFGPPGALYSNTITIAEIGTETNNGAVYTPLAGQPGFVAGAAAPVQYTFISDGTGPSVPEPSALLLMGSGLLCAATVVRRKLFR